MPYVIDHVKPLTADEKRYVRARLAAGVKPADLAFDLRVPEIFIRRLQGSRVSIKAPRAGAGSAGHVRRYVPASARDGQAVAQDAPARKRIAAPPIDGDGIAAPEGGQTGKPVVSRALATDFMKIGKDKS